MMMTATTTLMMIVMMMMMMTMMTTTTTTTTMMMMMSKNKNFRLRSDFYELISSELGMLIVILRPSILIFWVTSAFVACNSGMKYPKHTFAMIGRLYMREMTSKQCCKYSEYGMYEHSLSFISGRRRLKHEISQLCVRYQQVSVCVWQITKTLYKMTFLDRTWCTVFVHKHRYHASAHNYVCLVEHWCHLLLSHADCGIQSLRPIISFWANTGEAPLRGTCISPWPCVYYAWSKS